MKTITKMGLILALCILALNSYAVPITGTAQYVGITTPTGGGGTFATATGLSFSTKGNVTLSDGVLGNVFFTGGAAESVITLYDFAFNTQPGVGGITIFTQDSSDLMFKLTSINIHHQDSDFLNLSGVGVFSASGYDDTVGKWHFSTQSVAGSQNPQVTFSASVSSTDVTEPAALSLLSLGLMGVGLSRKLKPRKLNSRKLKHS